jgi:hypothetical protein
VIEVTIEAPVGTIPDAAYYAMLDRLSLLFAVLIGVAGVAGGGTIGVALWRIAGVALTVAQIIALITPDKRDDATVAEWKRAYDEKMMAQAAAAGTQAAIDTAMSKEREKLTA